jgi:hypothetical protein
MEIMVKIEELLKMKGEWVGTGVMTVGDQEGPITEYLKLEGTDIDSCLSYIRKSRIDFPGRPLLHNELGYMQTDEVQLLLSGGSYVILPWNKRSLSYEQSAGSPDSKDMVRMVTFPSAKEMVWDNKMLVNHGGHWVPHTAVTRFISITKA